MSNILQRFKDMIFWQRFKYYNKENHKQKILNWWIANGRKIPPPHEYKQKLIKDYKYQYSINILVESGTFRGEMVYAQKDIFKKIYSVELSKTLYEKVAKRLRKFRNVSLFYGDSREIIPKILRDISEPSIFWLDGHYSGFETAKGVEETPVRYELEYIMNSPYDHLILIDDARMFNGKNDYPRIEELKAYTLKKKFNYYFVVENDIIKILPNVDKK